MPNPTRPTEQPLWATTGTIIEPSSAKKQQGWIAEKPAWQYFNWLLNLIYQWCLWLDFITYSPNLQSTVSGDFMPTFPVRTYFVTTLTGNVTCTLPAASSMSKGYRVTVKHISIGSSNTVNVAITGGDTVENQSTDQLSQGDVRTYETDGAAAWWTI